MKEPSSERNGNISTHVINGVFMKNFAACTGCFAFIGLLVMMLSGCKGDAGPQGPSGEGSTSLEGFAVGIKCGTCHDPDQDTTLFIAGRAYQWAQSKHAIGGDIERNGASCGGCHTTEGFIERMKGLPVTDHLTPSPPGCFACHSPHARGNFSLRKIEPVTVRSNIQGVADAVFDYGKGNLCAQCHQTRPMTPKMDGSPANDSIVITTSRWYSHYGVQSQMLMGEGGFKFPDYTYTGNSYHTGSAGIREEGCVTCHMAEQVYPPNAGTGKAGGHTMNIHYAFDGVESELLSGCKQSECHASISTTDFAGSTTTPVGAQTAVVANLDTLFTLLGDRGWIDTVSTSANFGQVALVGGKRVITPAVKAGALYNYFFVEHDLSEGVHNTKYAMELLRSSIAELRKP
jgi:hypothetical protein